MSIPSIRPMGIGDAKPVADLATQLGYASSETQVMERIPGVIGREDAAALVADEAGTVVGWTHIELRRTLVGDREAQIMALVVDERCRGQGIGAALTAAAERWAHDRGATTLRVGSRTSREDAHRFYEREGYVLAKTSYWFEKELA